VSRDPAFGGSAAALPWTARRVVVGVGEMALSNRRDEVIVTYALGSCVAVCLYDRVATVAALLHFLLPEASINPSRALEQPAAFADTGIPLLLNRAEQYGLRRDRASVRLIGGAEIAAVAACATGRRNVLAARTILWRQGLFLEAQEVGGVSARTVHLSVGDGRLRIFNGREQIKEM
jgi:chemotaxis protein CheD